MTINAGTRLGRYEIRSLLGAGGMGEVYLAHDTSKLDRDVAVKVLPADFSREPSRLERFEQEARAASALNHPNILSVYDFGEHDGSPFVVSELLEGETLREQLSGGPLSQRRAIEYALQIASGLAAAHERGIVHRDLKPENIFVTADGRVKILDFGIAKLVERGEGASAETDVPTRRINTDPGNVVGTVGYMSPEQVRGHRVDARADIFSFGCVLYEMLSGRRAFRGETPADTLSAILREDPTELSETGRQVAPALERILRHCLEKSPANRFQSARDLAFALESLSTTSGASTQDTKTAREAATALLVPPARTRWRARLPWLIAALAALLAVAALAFAFLRRAPEQAGSVVRFPVTLPEEATLYLDTDPERHSMSVSPDGRRLVFVVVSMTGQRRLYVRALDALDSQPLAGTDGAYSPFWSPDGRSVAFFAEGKLKKIDAAGGAVQTVCDVAEQDTSGTWGRDGTILFAYDEPDFTGLMSVSAAGGAPVRSLNAEKVIPVWPSFLPDGRHFLFDGQHNSHGGDDKRTGDEGIYVGTLGSQEIHLLLKTPLTRVEYAPPGYLLYAREGVLFAQPFDADALRLTGEPVVAVEHVAYFDKTGWAEFSTSETGVLVHENILTSRLAWFDRAGRELAQFGQPAFYGNPALSPDGQRLAVTISDQQTGSGDLFIYDLARGTSTRFTFGPLAEDVAVWSPDGRRIAYMSCCERGKSTFRIKDVSDTTGAGASPLPSGFAVPTDWSPDGRFIIYMLNDPTAQRDIWVLPVSGEQKPFPFVQTQFEEVSPKFSPDGRFVAYVSNESGRDEVYVRRFPATAEQWRVSTAGGTAPAWRRDGKEIFYVSSDARLTAVPVRTGATFEAGTPAPLFTYSYYGGDYTVAADGQRFLLNTSVPGVQSKPFTVVLNWTAALGQKQ